jgi:hypothetical protein
MDFSPSRGPVKLPSSIRKLAQRATGAGKSVGISPEALEAAAKREAVLVLSFGEIDDRLPGEQRRATLGDLAAICAGVSRDRLIVAHCG